MRQAEQSDFLGWGLSFAIAKSIRWLGGKAPFPGKDPSPYKIGSKARIILVGDWASGVPRAVKVAKQIENVLQDPAGKEMDRHVIHLGDVYYAGRGFEYEQRLASYWPIHAGQSIGSWCLNGNHDMFTGGHQYFEFLNKDPRFARQAGCSYFGLENDDWLILGLDTAYESEGLRGNSGGLADPQPRWIGQQCERARNKKLIFLSHHQLFSPWEGDSPLLAQRLESILKAPRPISAWFWGHEHRCAVYEPSHNIQYPALVGHGGVPVYAWNKSTPKGVRYHYTESFRRGLERFALMGFAQLDLDGPHATVSYINENGMRRTTADQIG